MDVLLRVTQRKQYKYKFQTIRMRDTMRLLIRITKKHGVRFSIMKGMGVPLCVIQRKQVM